MILGLRRRETACVEARQKDSLLQTIPACKSMKHAIKTAPVLGVIYGNRDFFPDQLITESRKDIAHIFSQLGIGAIHLAETDSKLGGVETHAEARKCAEL